MESSLFSVTDAQAYLGGISRTMLYALLEQGQIKRVNIGRRAFITRASMDDYVAAISA